MAYNPALSLPSPPEKISKNYIVDNFCRQGFLKKLSAKVALSGVEYSFLAAGVILYVDIVPSVALQCRYEAGI